MNKHQEALDLLACNSEQWVVNHPKTSTPIHEIFYESDRAKDLLQELIDKQTPKKPVILFSFGYINDESETIHHVMGCSKCRMPIEKHETETPKHCHNCGQAFERVTDEPSATN